MPQLPDKLAVLRAYHAAHPHPAAVVAPLFASDQAFFDPRDLVQVKYELLRRADHDHVAVAQVSRDFGLSRQAFYVARASWQRAGWAGLLPGHPGPREGYRLDGDVLAYLARVRAQHTAFPARQLAHLVEEQFQRRVHPRSSERALARTGGKNSAKAGTRAG